MEDEEANEKLGGCWDEEEEMRGSGGLRREERGMRIKKEDVYRKGGERENVWDVRRE